MYIYIYIFDEYICIYKERESDIESRETQIEKARFIDTYIVTHIYSSLFLSSVCPSPPLSLSLLSLFLSLSPSFYLF